MIITLHSARNNNQDLGICLGGKLARKRQFYLLLAYYQPANKLPDVGILPLFVDPADRPVYAVPACYPVFFLRSTFSELL